MSKPGPQRTSVLLHRVDSATAQLLSKFSEIVELSANQGKDRATSSSDAFQIEANGSTIVRACEDLLFVTRSLKEAWILGQAQPIKEDEDDAESTNERADRLLEAILDKRVDDTATNNE